MTATEETLVLVDENDRETGVAPKLRVHEEGLRHRAISVIVVNRRGDMLLQRRRLDKYHSGGLWTNACCSHPRPGETTPDAAARRLREEMGFDCPLQPLFVTTYRAQVGDLIEHELVHVFGGVHEGAVVPDPLEVESYEWIGIGDLNADMAARPERYTVWFRKYMGEFGGGVAALATAARANS